MYWNTSIDTWRPQTLSLQRDGHIKRLGVRWDMSLHNITQDMMTTEQLGIVVGRTISMPCTINLKKAVLEGLVFQSLVFRQKKFAFWLLEHFEKLDEVLSKIICRMHKLDAQ